MTLVPLTPSQTQPPPPEAARVVGPGAPPAEDPSQTDPPAGTPGALRRLRQRAPLSERQRAITPD